MDGFMSIHASVLENKKLLQNLDGWLQKAVAYAEAKKFDPNVLLESRLAPDMFPLMRQIQAACDQAKYGAIVDRVQGLDITTIAGCHTPAIEGAFIGQAFDLVRGLPALDPPALPDQSVLDQVVAASAQPAT